MITELTPEQEKLMVAFRQKWLDIGLCTDPADKPRAEAAITQMYEYIGEGRPYFWWCRSPVMAQLIMNMLEGDNLGDNLGANLRANLWANLWDNLETNLATNLKDNLRDNLRANLWANLETNLRDNLRANLRANLWANLRDNLWDNLGANLWANLGANLWANLRANLRDNLGANLWANLWDNLGANLAYKHTSAWGQHDSYWISFYLFCHEIGVTYSDKDHKKLTLWSEIAQSCMWWYPYQNICFVCDRPSGVHKDDDGLLHNSKGPAISFRDGYQVYTWKGRNIPADKTWIITQPERITPEAMGGESNAEIRRIMLEILGGEKYLEQSNAKLVDSDDINKVYLYETDWTPEKRIQFTLSICHSTGRKYVEFLGDNKFTSVQDAMDWQWDTKHYKAEIQS